MNDVKPGDMVWGFHFSYGSKVEVGPAKVLKVTARKIHVERELIFGCRASLNHDECHGSRLDALRAAHVEAEAAVCAAEEKLAAVDSLIAAEVVR